MGFIGSYFRELSDVPDRYVLRIDHDWEARRLHRMRESEGCGLSGRRVEPLPPEGTVTIHLEYCVDRKADKWKECSICINPELKEFDRQHTSGFLFGWGWYWRSIAEEILSFPLKLLAWPLIAAPAEMVSWYWISQETKHGMCREGVVLLRALAGLLDDETHDLLVATLRKAWKSRQEANRTVTLEEAKSILASCDLSERQERVWEGGRSCLRSRHFVWSNEGKQIAYGRFDPALGDHFVQVLGSRFRGKQADYLCSLNKTHQMIVR